MVAVLFALLCTVVILHCILLRQQRQYVQSSHPMVILHISHSESLAYVQEKINDDNTVPSISKSSPQETGCPFKFSHLSPSSLEKASDNDISNRRILCPSDVSFLWTTVTGPTIARPVVIPRKDSQWSWWTLDIQVHVRKLLYGLEIASSITIQNRVLTLCPPHSFTLYW